jgi:hypothetical protein
MRYTHTPVKQESIQTIVARGGRCRITGLSGRTFVGDVLPGTHGAFWVGIWLLGYDRVETIERWGMQKYVKVYDRTHP